MTADPYDKPSPKTTTNDEPPQQQSQGASPPSSTGSATPPPSTGAPPPNGGNPPPITGSNPPPTTGASLLSPLTGLNPADGDGGTAIIGDNGLLQPVADVANGAVNETLDELQQLADKLGAGGLVAELVDVVQSTGLGNIGAAAGSDSNLITDLVNAPADILSGKTGDVISNVSEDLGDVLTQTFELKDEAVLDGNDPLNPVPGLIENVGSGLQTMPILSIGGGNGLLGGTAGDLTQSSSGHLIDIGIGPTSDDGLSLSLLATPGSGAGPALGVSVLDVGPDGPNLLNLNVLGGEIPLLGGSGNAGLLGNILPQSGGEGGGLPGGAISIPSLGGNGSDGLVGEVLGSLASPAGGEGAPSPGLPAVAIVGEVVAQTAVALDLGDHNQNHGLLGLA